LKADKLLKEAQGWDLKFQNYWGYTITAEDDKEAYQEIMSEKLFKHVGDFRMHA